MNPREVATCACTRPIGSSPRRAHGSPSARKTSSVIGVQPAVEDEDRRLAIHVVADRAAPQREVVVAQEAHHRREVEASLEPRLDLVHAAALDVERMLAREQAQVVVDRLGHHDRAGSARLRVVERQRGQQQHAQRQGRDQGAAPARPPRAARARPRRARSRRAGASARAAPRAGAGGARAPRSGAVSAASSWAQASHPAT